MKTKSPLKTAVASSLAVIVSTGPGIVLDSNACQTTLGYLASLRFGVQASVLNPDVYDGKEPFPANMSQVTFIGTDGSMLNITPNEAKTASDISTYLPDPIRYADNVYLRFLAPLHLVIGKDKKTMHVEGWDVVFPVRNLCDIDKHLVKRFEDLYRKARENKLSEEEKKTWGNVVDSIDYASFSQEMSFPQFEVGQITSLNENLAVVSWIDGEKERFRGHIPAFFTNGRMQKGDWFEALVKRGKQDMVVSIEYPQKIDPPAEYDLESLEVYKL